MSESGLDKLKMRGELQARAEGHYTGELFLRRCDAVSAEGHVILNTVAGPGGLLEWQANAARAVITWNAHDAMKAALEAVRKPFAMSRKLMIEAYEGNYSDLGDEERAELDEANECLAVIDAALALARGQK
jgi:hypothetical protein